MSSKYSLAISTINNTVSVCIFKNMKTIQQIHNIKKDNRNVNRLFNMIEQLLSDCKINYKEIAEIYVSVGPGSFTAIRINLAYVMGLKVAKNIDVYGVSNMQLIAYLAKLNNKLQEGYCLLDAQRNQLFIQKINITTLEELSECKLVDYSSIQELSNLSLIVDKTIYKKLTEIGYNNTLANMIDFDSITAKDLGLCGALLKAQSLTKPITPLYIRLPDAKPLK